MTNLAALTRATLEAKALADLATERAYRMRQRLDDAMREAGSHKQAIDGYGTIIRTGGNTEGAITDEAALMEWTREHRPDMVIMKPVFRSGWVDLLKRMAAEFGVVSDPETGQRIPGIEVRLRPFGLRVATAPGALESARATLPDLGLDDDPE